MSTHLEVTIFLAARELRDPSAPAAFLAQACVDDALRARIEERLQNRIEGVTNASAPQTRLEPLEKAGDTIGRYKLLQQVGKGGCGVVYMAEQAEPVRRKVALKVIKLGMDTRNVIARFEAERQALAMMDHPNIAKVLDAGATGTGRPYFVMELVRGIPITKYCDENKLPTPHPLHPGRAIFALQLFPSDQTGGWAGSDGRLPEEFPRCAREIRTRKTTQK